ncbi:MAG: hypothetical protein ACRDKZ_08975 [Actinomycetota bacterium]
MELIRPTRGELLAGAAGLALFLLSFFDLWGTYRVSALNVELSLNFSLWEGYGFLPKFGVLLGLIAAGLVLVRALGASHAVPPSAYFVLGSVAFICMLVAVVAGPVGAGEGDLSPDIGYEEKRAALAFVAPLPAAALAAGGWLHLRDQAVPLRRHRDDAVPPGRSGHDRTEAPPQDV